MHLLIKIVFMWVVAGMFQPALAGEISANYYDIGVFAFEEGNFKDAEAYLTQAVRRNPEDALACFYLGRTYQELAQTADARRYFKKASAIDPSIPGLNYHLGILFYENNEFDTALEYFSRVIAENPEDVLALYYAGVSRYKLAQYKAAEPLLMQAARMSPSIEMNGNYYAGICNYHLKRFPLAAAQFEQVVEMAPEGDMKENARMWIDAVRQKKAEAKPYFLYLKTGAVYDDNVILAPENLDQVSDESDAGLMAYFSGKYDFLKNQDLVSGVGYSHYQTRYQDLDAYNLTGSMGNFYVNWHLNPALSFECAYQPMYYWVDGDSYLMQHQVVPAAVWRIDPLNLVDFSYRYSRDNYFTDNGRDGHANEVTLEFFHQVQAFSGNFFCGVGSEVFSAHAKDQNFTELSALAGISADIMKNTRLTVYGQLFDKTYDHQDAVYKKKRDDNRYLIFASVTQTLWRPWLQVSAEYTFMKNNSSISDFDYERNTILLAVSVKL